MTISKTIVESDAFLDMPPTAQSLYVRLCLNADDDGYVGNPKLLCSITDSNDDDLKLLIAENFVSPLDNGIGEGLQIEAGSRGVNMTRVNIENSLIKYAEGAHWMPKKSLAGYFGLHPKSAKIDDVTRGLLKFGNLYSARDLSEKIYSMQKE